MHMTVFMGDKRSMVQVRHPSRAYSDRPNGQERHTSTPNAYQEALC